MLEIINKMRGVPMKEHRSELEVYSGIAILFVVFLHSNAYYLTNILKLGSYVSAGMFLNFIDKIVHVAVPMFIFIAGYKYQMNNKNDTYREFFIKKFNGVFKPFFFISTFYLFYFWCNVFYLRLIYNGKAEVQFVILNLIKNFFRMFLGYNFAYQFWYIPMYLLIVLSYPIVARYIKNINSRFVFYFTLAITWEIIACLKIPYINNNPYPIKFIYYFFLYELGCIFYSKNSKNINPKPVMLLYILLLIATSLMKNALYTRLLYELIFVPISVMAFFYISLKIKDNKLLIYLGKNSLYIYMLHEPLVLSVISRYLLRHGLYRFGVLAPMIAILSIILSIVIYNCLIRIPALKFLFTKDRKSQVMKISG